MPKSIKAWVSLWGKFYKVFIKQTQKKSSNHSNSLLALEQQRERWWGEKYSCPFCALEYFIRITNQQYNKRKETKKTSKFPKIVKVKWWNGIFPNYLATTSHFSNPTLGVLLLTMDGSQAFCWAIERDGNLKSFCSWVYCLHQTPLFSSLYLTSLPDLSSPSTTPLYLITSLSLSLLLLGLWCSSREDLLC